MREPCERVLPLLFQGQGVHLGQGEHSADQKGVAEKQDLGTTPNGRQASCGLQHSAIECHNRV